MPYNESINDKEKSKKVQTMFNNIASKYDFLNKVLSLKLDSSWRNKAIKMVGIEANDKVLDLACGTGDMMIAIKKNHPDSKVFGADFSVNMLTINKKKIPDSVLSAADAHFLPYKNNSFNKVTISFGFRNVADKSQGLKELYRVLDNNGRICILELTQPENRFINAIYKLYFKKLLPYIGGMFSSKKAYTYLPDSVYLFPRRKEFQGMIEEAGFKNIKFKSMLFGAVTAVSMEKK